MNLLASASCKISKLAQKKHAIHFLFWLSFFEACILPIPPDLLLIPLVLARPNKYKYYTFITILASVLGGVVGYILGAFAYDAFIANLIFNLGWQDKYSLAINWFQEYGFLSILVVGFTPVPYKLFTIAAGVAKYSLPYFVIASIIGRSIRFILVTGISLYIRPKINSDMMRCLDKLSFGVLAGFCCYFVWRVLF